MKNITSFGLVAFSAAILLSSCKKDKETIEEEITEITRSSVVLSLENEAQKIYPMHLISEAGSGTADIEAAQEIHKSSGAIVVTSKDQKIYVTDFDTKTFQKLSIDSDGILVTEHKVPITGVNGNPLSTFIGDSKILLTPEQTYPKDGVISYQMINISDLTELKKGTIQLPIDDKNPNYAFSWANQYYHFEGKIYVPFIESNEDWGFLTNISQIAVYDATNMKYIKKITSSKTSSLGNGFNSSSAIDENGNLYISSSNANQYNYDESTPSGIVRIKKGETTIDKDYFLDITKATGSHSLGMVYVGNNKAIVQVFEKSKLESDYFIDYYVVNLSDQSVRRLDIPSSLGSQIRRTMTKLANGNVAIVNNTSSTNSLYVYDSNTDKVSVGVKYTGADYINGVQGY